MAQLEAKISTTIRKSFIEQVGGWAEKVHQGALSGAGLPDLWLGARGICAVVETKCKDEPPKRLSSTALHSSSGSPAVSRIQSIALQRGEDAGFVAGVMLCYWAPRDLYWLPLSVTRQLGRRFDEGLTLQDVVTTSIKVPWLGKERWDMRAWFEHVTEGRHLMSSRVP